MNTSDLSSNVYWLTVCVPQNRECFAPSAPVLDSSISSDNLQSQTILLKAEKPENFDADVVIWEISKYTGSGYQVLYEFTSRDGVPSGLDAADVLYGATGLEAENNFYARVAYCSESSPGTIDRCTCRSGYGGHYTTSSLDGASPTAPLVQRVEDQFRRRNTNKSIDGGEGIGPPEVWFEISSGSGGRQKIIDNERVAAAHSAPIVYVQKAAASGHTYAAALYKRSPSYTGSEFNVDAIARVALSAGSNQIKGYAVKLVNETAALQLPEAGAELQVRRYGGSATEPLYVGGFKVANLSGTGCGATIPLGTNGSTEPVWVRIEVERNSQQDPRIKGEVAWGGCTETGALSTCSSHYYFANANEDSEDPATLKGVTGNWAYFFHHRDAIVESFNAGSANAP
jgi:hypothetical protein